ncbi:hypothetical protein ACFHW1_05145 [Micromonospora sp. LOL_014]|uniref:hypothetical protein n=1 Tax=Micromonospora sp. LOL_014 TaxID=3345415 RepID=UPI003A842AC3
MTTLADLTAQLAAEPSHDAARARALELIQSAVTRASLSGDEQSAEVRRILVALDGATEPVAPALPADVEADLRRVAAETGEDYRHVRDLYDALSSMDEEEEIARVEEDAATRREHDAEAQAEVDAEAAELAAQLRAESITATELAAVELLTGAGIHAIDGFPVHRLAGGASGWRVRWDRLRVGDGWRMDVGRLTDEQAMVHDLAVALATGERIDLREVMQAVADDEQLRGLILGAVRIALSPMPAVTR